jgi:tetratricopeptide (TPR) repeat protein/tRNA A-37 threonylcarbamoyl transferase component Bud32
LIHNREQAGQLENLLDPHRPSREELFNTALDHPPGEDRETFLRAACGDDAQLLEDIRSLLSAHAEAETFLKSVDPKDLALGDVADEGPTVSSCREAPGQMIGRYKLLELLGEGGFGSVWMAEQREPVKRRVALKIIKLGMDTKQVVARFEAERQALAMMDHPNIARVLDAGATDTGRPFFVMELVRGVPILEYCDTERLDTFKRLELFVDVCNAIQHAHQKGVIHRDIKPSNILVTLHDGRPVPKVIDFGIAKATSGELTEKTLFTQHRQMIGTPAYMSPEQAEMSGLDIDTRSDIYSLGVLLYELLTGTTPFSHEELLSKGFSEMMRIIRDVEPRKPSTRLSTMGETITRTAHLRHAAPARLGSILKGDLDWIVMKCLEKDRQRRYDTANGLGLDVRRFLSGDAVLAAPPGKLYVIRKFMRRHRASVTAGAAVAAALLIGIIGFFWQAQAARAQRDLAEREARRALAAESSATQRAEQLQLFAEFQASQLAETDVTRMGARIRSVLTERRRDALARSGHADEEVQIAMSDFEEAMAGVNFTDVALQALDENTLSRTLRTIEEKFSSQPLIKAALLQTTSDSIQTLGLLDRAVSPQAEALAIRHRILGDNHPDTLASAGGMGVIAMKLGRLPQAEVYLQQALAGRRAVLGNEHPDTLESMVRMGELHFRQLRLTEAEPLFREALEYRQRILGPRHPDTLRSLHYMGNLLRQQRRDSEAEPYLREALEGRRDVLGDEHPDTLSSLNAWGLLLRQQGKQLETEDSWRAALTARRRVLGDEHPDTLTSMNNLGGALRDQKRYPESESLFREALNIRRRTLGDDHPDTLQSFSSLGITYFQQGKFVEAEAQYRSLWESYRRNLGEEHELTLSAAATIGRTLVGQGRLEEAESVFRETLGRTLRSLGEAHWQTRQARSMLAEVLQRREGIHGPNPR